MTLIVRRVNRFHGLSCFPKIMPGMLKEAKLPISVKVQTESNAKGRKEAALLSAKP